MTWEKEVLSAPAGFKRAGRRSEYPMRGPRRRRPERFYSMVRSLYKTKEARGFRVKPGTAGLFLPFGQRAHWSAQYAGDSLAFSHVASP
jgi:hypothetical protein